MCGAFHYRHVSRNMRNFNSFIYFDRARQGPSWKPYVKAILATKRKSLLTVLLNECMTTLCALPIRLTQTKPTCRRGKHLLTGLVELAIVWISAIKQSITPYWCLTSILRALAVISTLYLPLSAACSPQPSLCRWNTLRQIVWTLPSTTSTSLTISSKWKAMFWARSTGNWCSIQSMTSSTYFWRTDVFSRQISYFSLIVPIRSQR